MELDTDLADHLFSIMVATIGTPNIDYRRWAFIYSITVLKATNYTIDSKLGTSGRFNNRWPLAPTVTCTQIDPENKLMMSKANTAFAHAVRRKLDPVRRTRASVAAS